ncbi:hypothetical protein FRC01_009916 [Tulasnella sp. 417]|nr:hypothetical protein FRC01_009916 [Tulasnella sp. 417]
MSASPLTPHLWHSPQTALALARNLTNNFYYSVYAHFGLIWPDTLPKEVLATLTANDQYPETTAIPDNDFIQRRIKPAIEFLLPILRQLLMDQELQEGCLVEVDARGAAAKQGWHLSLASKLRKAQDELKLQDPAAMSIQKALRQHPTALPQMINRLSSILFMIKSDSDTPDLLESSPGQAAGSADLIDFTSPIEESSGPARTTLGSPLLLATPLLHPSLERPAEEESDNDTDDSEIISPQHPLESPFTEQSVHRAYPQSPSTAPTTPFKSPSGAQGASRGKTANDSPQVLVTPATPDAPTIILTVPTGSSDGQPEEGNNPAVEESKETETPAPAVPDAEQNRTEDAKDDRQHAGASLGLTSEHSFPDRRTTAAARCPTCNESKNQCKQPTSGELLLWNEVSQEFFGGGADFDKIVSRFTPPRSASYPSIIQDCAKKERTPDHTSQGNPQSTQVENRNTSNSTEIARQHREADLHRSDPNDSGLVSRVFQKVPVRHHQQN